MTGLHELVPVVVPTLIRTPLDSVPVQVHGGYANSSWRVSARGQELLVKVAHAGAPLDKARSASHALRLASSTPAPVPYEVFFDPSCAALLGRVVRIQTWLAGQHPGDHLTGSTSAAFFAGLGAAVAALHQARWDGFTTRLGGEPHFTTWVEFVRHRAMQVRDRALVAGAFSAGELDRMLARVERVAGEVSPLVTPRLVHRDLHLDNVLVSGSGGVAGLLDLDGAGAWDPAVDLVKLRAQVFPHHPGSERAFTRGYAAAAGGLPDQLDRRVAVTEVLELSNAVANAGLNHNDVMVEVNRRRLAEVLRQPW